MCTGIKIDYNDGCVLGRTMDYESPMNYNGLYLPRNYNYAKDLMGRQLHSRYRMLGVCFHNRDPLKDGVNEHGLVGITNDFAGFNLYAQKVDTSKINLSSLDYFNYALANYKSVQELVDDLPNIHISTRNHKGEKAISPDFHFMFSDSTKRCIVVEPKSGDLICYENPYDVMTNSPGFGSHVRRLNKYIDMEKLEEFNASKDLPGGYDPVSRFIKAFYMTRRSKKASGYHEALSYFHSIMNAMTLPDGFIRNKKYDYTTYTRYICSYDTKGMEMTLKSDTNPMVYRLGFEDLVDMESRQAFFVDMEFRTHNLIGSK
ncbi:linear amide C-N hydrolase [Gudongella sp. SC589]|uniref:linear amide C-N hydrolase n=1 Tax=Gudongella sp. SC589 TaxID=3385990 RepID=UPI003904DBEF